MTTLSRHWSVSESIKQSGTCKFTNIKILEYTYRSQEVDLYPFYKQYKITNSIVS